MDIDVSADGRLQFRERRYTCALGRNGLVTDKREGDGGTPIGRFRLRRVLYRPDRLASPATALDVIPLAPDDGWCDMPGDRRYNQPVNLPYPARAEALWRADHLYDVVVVLGHNDEPVIADRGSAIFLHVAGADYGPTEGCVALALSDLCAVLADCDADTHLHVQAP